MQVRTPRCAEISYKMSRPSYTNTTSPNATPKPHLVVLLRNPLLTTNAATVISQNGPFQVYSRSPYTIFENAKHQNFEFQCHREDDFLCISGSTSSLELFFGPLPFIFPLAFLGGASSSLSSARSVRPNPMFSSWS